MKGKTGYLRGFASFLRGFASYGLTIIGYPVSYTHLVGTGEGVAAIFQESAEDIVFSRLHADVGLRQLLAQRHIVDSSVGDFL